MKDGNWEAVSKSARSRGALPSRYSVNSLAVLKEFYSSSRKRTSDSERSVPDSPARWHTLLEPHRAPFFWVDASLAEAPGKGARKAEPRQFTDGEEKNPVVERSQECKRE